MGSSNVKPQRLSSAASESSNSISVDISAPPTYDEATNTVSYEKAFGDDVDMVYSDELEEDFEKLDKDPANRFFTLYDRIHTSDDNFNVSFADWYTNRAELVSRLLEIAAKCDGHRLRCNVSTITGSSVGIVGGSVGIAGLILMPPVALVGVAIAGVGGAANLITGLTEFGITKSKQKVVRALLKEDVDKTKALVAYLEAVIGNWKALSEIAIKLNRPTLHRSIKENVGLLDEGRSLALLGATTKVALATSARKVAVEVVEGVAETTAPAAAKALSHTALALSLLLD
uniref:Uncharacterized protein n=1 Tax=Plectus sambesii TaxID=2011161 RepID=A0A914W7M5_9BILA